MLSVDKQVKLAIYVIYLIALIIGCIVGSVILWQSFSQTRETRIEVYKKDILAWNNTKRTEFSNVSIKLQYVNSDGSLGDISTELPSLTEESYEHQLDDETYGDLPSYEPYYYNLMSNASDFGIPTLETFSSFAKLTFNMLIDDGTGEQTVKLPPLDLYSIKTTHMTMASG